MKNIVGKVKITNSCTRTGVRIYINKDFIKLLGNRIVFYLSSMTIKRPTLDSNHTYSIKNKQFSFPVDNILVKSFLGKYKVIQEDEDTFKLKKIKIKNNGPHN